MRAEDAGPEVGPTRAVDEGANAVHESADPQEADLPVRQLPGQLAVTQQPGPAHHDVQGRRYLVGQRYGESADQDAAARHDPHAGQDSDAPAAAHGDHRHRRGRARDEQENAHVIDALAEVDQLRNGAHGMVQPGAEEAADQANAEDSEAEVLEWVTACAGLQQEAGGDAQQHPCTMCPRGNRFSEDERLHTQIVGRVRSSVNCRFPAPRHGTRDRARWAIFGFGSRPRRGKMS